MFAPHKAGRAAFPNIPGSSANQPGAPPDPVSKTGATESNASPPKEGDSSVPSISPPTVKSGSGSGTFRGLGETFRVNPANGTVGVVIPIRTTPGRSNFGPILNLSYNSGGGNGPFGLGWSLDVFNITRKTSKRVPLYDDTDTFIFSNAEDLVPVSTPELNDDITKNWIIKSYKPRIETSFDRVECWTDRNDHRNIHWRTTSPDGTTSLYGTSDASRIMTTTSDGATHIFSWLVACSYDLNGNAMRFDYKAENLEGIDELAAGQKLLEEKRQNNDSQRYLKCIKYGNCTPNRDPNTWLPCELPDDWLYQVVFDYGEHCLTNPTLKETASWRLRTDRFSAYRIGFEIRTRRLCQRILMFHCFPTELKRSACLVASSQLNYSQTAAGSTLTSFISSGHLPQGTTDYQTESFPPLEFFYSNSYDLTNAKCKTFKTSQLQGLPDEPGRTVNWVDLDGEGSPGLLAQIGDAVWTFQRNQAVLKTSDNIDYFGPVEVVQKHPTATGLTLLLEDLDGNGCLDLVSANDQGNFIGYRERTDGGWGEFVPFQTMPSDSPMGDRWRRSDLTGNGLPDLFCIDPSTNELIWHEGLGKNGFSPERRVNIGLDGPSQALLDDLYTGIFCTDISGDSLSDIVRVKRGSISYWPNLGYGRFGREIIMNNAPLLGSSDFFEADRIRLVDITGSGMSDLIYFPATGKATVYYNLAGNAWSDPHEIANFPAIDNLSQVFVMDLLGDGSASLCWQGPNNGASSVSRKLRYLNLSGNQKPNSMVQYTSGTGMSITMEYKSSNWFYHQDRKAERPWATKLASPVDCVSRTTFLDKITGTILTTDYRYHDGFYDGREREFRGFAMAEERQQERFSVNNKSFARPATLTKRWFFTGASATLPAKAHMYTSPALSGCDFPLDLTDAEVCEVHRALKGQLGRVEIFSDDDSEQVSVPYQVSEHTYSVRHLNSSLDGGPGVYAVNPKENLTFVHERSLKQSPRRTHELILEVNDYNDPLYSLTISYGRKDVDEDPTGQQQTPDIQYRKLSYTNPITERHTYRKPLQASLQEYKLLGWPTGELVDYVAIKSGHKDLIETMKESTDLYVWHFKAEQKSPPSKILTKEMRRYYRSSDLTTRLRLNRMESFSVMEQEFSLELLEGMLPPTSSAACLDQKWVDTLKVAGYIKLDDDERWWTPSSRNLYANVDSEEFQAARSSFYQPCVTIDPFKNKSFVEYDKYKLFPVRSEDALENITVSKYNYIAQKATTLQDANGNIKTMVFDPMGELLSTATSGKAQTNMGDSTDGVLQVTDQNTIDRFLQDPAGPAARELLGKATTRLLYGRSYYHQTLQSSDKPQSVFVASIKRTRHASEEAALGPADLMISVTWMDAKGRPFVTADYLKAGKWRFSGYTYLDNNSQIFREYQPFFATSHMWQPPSESQVLSGTTYFWDPLGRQVGKLNPDHTWSKTKVEPWIRREYDEGDTIMVDQPSQDDTIGPFLRGLDSESYLPTWHSAQLQIQEVRNIEQARKSQVFRDTPRVIYQGPKGNDVVVVEDFSSLEAKEYRYYDHWKNVQKVVDCIGRTTEMRRFTYSGQLIYKVNMDSGEQWSLNDCQGQLLQTWNSRNIRTRVVYDELRRKCEVRMKAGTESEILVERIQYGEREDNPESRNLRTQAVRSYGQFGIRTNESFDFKGNCLRSWVQYAKVFDDTLDWTNDSSITVEEQKYTNEKLYDALDRVIYDTDASGCCTWTTFNANGQHESISWKQAADNAWQKAVLNASYTAASEVECMVMGNGIETEYVYDQNSPHLLLQKRTQNQQTRRLLEQVQYFYDCQNRIVSEVETKDKTLFFQNTAVLPQRDFTYDSMGRLVQATGREQVNASHGGGTSLTPYGPKVSGQKQGIPGDETQLCQYIETYQYDLAGNILQMRHTHALPMHT